MFVYVRQGNCSLLKKLNFININNIIIFIKNLMEPCPSETLQFLNIYSEIKISLNLTCNYKHYRRQFCEYILNNN